MESVLGSEAQAGDKKQSTCIAISQKDVRVRQINAADNKGFTMDKLLDKDNEAAHEGDITVANDNTSHNLRFGIRGWRPDCLQRFNDPKWFILCLSMFSLSQAIVVNGFVVASISTIEKEFGFSSQQSGIIMAANDLSGLLFVPMISFFCTSKRPKWIACGSLFCGIGALLFTLPKLIVGMYEPTIISGGMTSLAACFARSNVTMGGPLPSLCGSKAFSVESISLLVFIVAQIVMGIGAAPLFTLGPAYIDENVDPKMAPIYLGIWWATTFLGPGLGLILGGSFLSIYVDIKQPVGANLTMRDPQWLGAWWLSFFSLAWILLLNSVLLTCYPTKIKKSRQKRDEAIKSGHLPNDDKSVEMTLRGMGRATLNLLTHKTFIFAVLAFTIRTMYGVGLGAFFSKLIIIKFGLRADKAGMILGVVIIPGMTMGIMLGAYIMKKIPLRSSARWAAAICFVCSVIGCIASPLFMLPGCGESIIAGVEQPYHNSSLVMGSLRSTCNNGCGCSKVAFLPVCGSDGVSYYSPCYAGCSGFLSKTVFANCSCIPGSPRLGVGPASSTTHNAITVPITRASNQSTSTTFALNGTEHPTSASNSSGLTTVATVTPSRVTPDNRKAPWMSMSTARVGFCDRKCKNLVLFLALSTVMILIMFAAGTPHNMIVLRSVPANQRAYALGLQFVFMRGLSFIPGPLIAGSIIDSACKLWGVNSCGKRTHCYDYRVDTLSSSIATFAAATALAATLLYFISWYFSKPIDVASADENATAFVKIDECKRSEDDNANTAL